MTGLKFFLADFIIDLLVELKFTCQRSIWVDRLLTWEEITGQPSVPVIEPPTLSELKELDHAN
jgi:hypothetical protein